MKIERKSEKKKTLRKIRKNWDLYLLVFPIIAYFIIFKYVPMYGLQIAFKDFIAVDGIFNSPWVGLEHFERFFQSFYFERLLSNTLLIGLYELAVGFPIPIILALMINEVKNKYFKSFIQTITYAPHFLSVVVVVGILYLLLSPQTGIINQLIVILGGEPIYFMAEPAWFKTIFVFSGVWQNMGWSSIIYLAALSAIDPQLHEAAKIDGASRLQRIWYINLPSIKPTIIIMLILQCGSILGVGFEKVFLMQNSLNMSASDVISTHIYRTGILGADYSYSTAIGLFESFVNLIILLLVNYTARKVNKVSLW
ncbi:ABC transporter permease [Niallia sp. FSL M8-0099]|uniref:ABC transporter permease n=1 Tax=Niallia sp. FSL M8-0099 TaxID=2954519 RepID=UPI0030FAAEFE